MTRRVIPLASSILLMLGAASLILVVQGGAQTVDRGGMSVIITGPEGAKQCFLDARVGLTDGKVVDVAVQDSNAVIALGERVLDLPPGLETGNVIPGPVYRDSAGRLRAGYSVCVEVTP